MNVTIFADDRAMALMALELADKECDRVRDALDRLQVDDMAAQAFQGLLGEVRVELKDATAIAHDFSFEQRRALGIALLFYKATINKRRDGDTKLLIDPKEIIKKLGDVSALLERLSGQETLFTGSLAWTEPKPAKKRGGGGDDGDDEEDGDLFDDADEDVVEEIQGRSNARLDDALAGVKEMDDAHI